MGERSTLINKLQNRKLISKIKATPHVLNTELEKDLTDPWFMEISMLCSLHVRVINQRHKRRERSPVTLATEVLTVGSTVL